MVNSLFRKVSTFAACCLLVYVPATLRWHAWTGPRLFARISRVCRKHSPTVSPRSQQLPSLAFEHPPIYDSQTSNSCPRSHRKDGEYVQNRHHRLRFDFEAAH